MFTFTPALADSLRPALTRYLTTSDGYGTQHAIDTAEAMLTATDPNDTWPMTLSRFQRAELPNATEAWDLAHAEAAAAISTTAAIRDEEAAMRQAEALGATADQRAKLRRIVEERRDMERRAVEAEQSAAHLLTLVRAAEDPYADAEWESWRDVPRGVFVTMYGFVAAAGNEAYWTSLANSEYEGQVLPARYELADVRPLPLGNIGANDSFRTILATVGEKSIQQNMCPVFDQMLIGLGLPDRSELDIESERSFRVTGYATVTMRVAIHTHVNATSSDAALESADDGDLCDDDMSETLRDAVTYGNYEIDSVDFEDAEEE